MTRQRFTRRNATYAIHYLEDILAALPKKSQRAHSNNARQILLFLIAAHRRAPLDS